MYVTYKEYLSMTGADPDKHSEFAFNRAEYKAERELSRYITTVDGIDKLKTAFPTDAFDAEAVRRCICELTNLILEIEASEAAQQISSDAPHGPVSSVSSGSESISYSTGNTALNSAVSDLNARRALFTENMKMYLSGVKDANGVNLLFTGVYPCIKTQ